MIYTVTLNPGVDRTLVVREINFNAVLRAERLHLHSGGKGFNVSRILQQFEIPSTMIGFIGGSIGELMERDLKARGMDTRFVKINSETRNNLVIIESSTDRYIKVNEPGPMILPMEQNSLIRDITEIAGRGDYWAFCGSLPPGVPEEFYFQLIQRVQNSGGKACLDSSGEPFKLGCRASPFLVKPNIEEASQLTGVEIRDMGGACRAAELIMEMGVENTALSLGSDGLVFMNHEVHYQAVPPKTGVRNPTGAGDSMLAGLLFGLTHQLPIQDTLKWGVAAGTASAMKEDVASATIDEIKALFDRVEVRKIY